jgi:adenosylcobinamide-GDP ribazoletransferase
MSGDGLRLSVTLLSILPGSVVPAFDKNMEGHVPGQPADPGPAELGGMAGMGGPSWLTAAEAMLWAPLVGLVLGVIAAAVLYVFGHLLHTGSLVASVLAVGTLAVLTRGLHLDGLADLADGLGSRRPADGALAVMRRSDIGPFGVVTLVLVLLIQVAGLTQADGSGRGVPAIIVAAVTGRLAITWACRRGVPPARPDGLGALVAGSVSPVTAVALTVAVLAITVAGIFLAAAVAAVPVEWMVPVAVAAGLVAGAGLAEYASRRLGGVTGDVLGAVAETATAACLLVTAIS